MAGIWDALTGQNPNQGAINSATSSANAATGNQNTNLNAQAGIYNSLANGFNSNYSPLQPGIMGGFQNLLGPAAQGGNYQNLLMQAAGSPGGTSAFTGVNGGGLLNSYLNNIGGNVAGVAGGAQGANMGIGGAMGQNAGQLGGVGNYFGSLMQNGLDPAVIGNAMGNYQNGVQSQMNTIQNQAGPGVNEGALAQNLGQQAVMGQAQLQSNLAAQNQGVRLQGAQGAGTTANQLFSNTMGGLGQQFGNTLQSGQFGTGAMGAGYSAGQGFNQTALGNLNTAAGIPMQDLSALQGYYGQGLSSLEGAGTGLGNVAGAYGGQAGMYGGLANQYTQEGQQENASTMNMLGGIAGGVAGAGGFSGLFGGGGGTPSGSPVNGNAAYQYDPNANFSGVNSSMFNPGSIMQLNNQPSLGAYGQPNYNMNNGAGFGGMNTMFNPSGSYTS